MNLGKKRNVKWNIFYIVFYIIFLFFFPLLRNYLSGNEFSINKGAAVLNATDKFTDVALNSFEGVVGYFSSRKYLLSEVDRLKDELIKERSKNTVDKNLIENNAEIIIAKKIFTDFTTIYDTILIDKGSQDGVYEGDMVFVYENNVVGKISKVNKNSSLVTLFSKDKEKVEGVINASKNQNTVLEIELTDSQELEKGLVDETENILSEISNEDISPKAINKGSSILIDLFGYGGGDFVSYVPGNVEVSTGTIVYLAADESKYLGEIVSVEKQDASFYQILLIRGYYNTRQNDDYYILKN